MRREEEITQKIEKVDAKRAMIKEDQRALTSKDYEHCEELIQCLWKESEENPLGPAIAGRWELGRG